METSRYIDSTPIHTVSQVVKKLSLSRARFYQLLDQGVFPPPVYCCRSKKPLYTTGLLAQCLTVRKTGVGVNGQLVRFYAKRKHRKPDPAPRRLTAMLKKLGLPVKPSQVSKAMQQFGIRIQDEMAIDGDTIRKLFKHLYQECQEGV